MAEVRAAFVPYVYGAQARFTAACWTVGARASRELDSSIGRATAFRVRLPVDGVAQFRQ
jgi:hypothetical protein